MGYNGVPGFCRVATCLWEIDAYCIRIKFSPSCWLLIGGRERLPDLYGGNLMYFHRFLEIINQNRQRKVHV